MKAFFANPNVRHALQSPDMIGWIANTVAVDYLRRMHVDERPAAMAWLKRYHLAIHAEILRQYPHHAV
jgi:hypothetical protein